MQTRLFLLLVRPSFISLVSVIVAALILVIAVNGSYFTYNEIVFPILYGEFGAVTAIERSPALIEGAINGFSTNPIVYTIVVTGVAAVVGWIVFLLVRAIRRTSQTFEAIDQHTARQRGVARLVIGIMWIVFSIITFNFILPICLLYSRIGAEAITSSDGIITTLLSLLAIIITLHIHIVFARLFLLKPRIFGSKDTIQEASFPVHHI